MLSADLYIIAAGNGLRLNACLPKALLPIADEPCITTTLRRIGAKFRRVFVVTNVRASREWTEYFERLWLAYPQLACRTENLPINSGLGDGHATLQGLLLAQKSTVKGPAEDVVITWGDTFYLQADIVDELLAMPVQGGGLFPAVHESSPYVALRVDDDMQCTSADFSKHGEMHAAGFHDQSLFRFVRSTLLASLRDLHDSLWKRDRYLAPGGELSLLHTAHHLYNRGRPIRVYETHYRTLSFNTALEVSMIRRELRAPSEDGEATRSSG